MITIAEAHRALAGSLSDPYAGGAADIYDGVRFSALQRSLLLYRAMLRIITGTLIEVFKVPHNDRAEILQGVFPNMTSRANLTSTSTNAYSTKLTVDLSAAGVRGLAYPYYCKAQTTGNEALYVPLMPGSRSARVGRENRGSMLGDPIAHITESMGGDLSLELFHGQYDDIDPDECEVVYLGYPMRLTSTPPPANTDYLDVEPSHINDVLRIATLMGMIESNDLENAEQLLPMLR